MDVMDVAASGERAARRNMASARARNTVSLGPGRAKAANLWHLPFLAPCPAHQESRVQATENTI